MIVKDAQAARALDAANLPTRNWQLALLYGADDAGSRALADRVAAAMGTDGDRIDLDGATLKADPARLPDEANALSMFGGARWIRVTGGDETLAAVDALLVGPVGCPVVQIAGALTKASPLVKLATGDARVLGCQSWKLDGERADAFAVQLARPLGVRLAPDAARMLAEATAGDRAVLASELAKLALYVDAAPDRPRPVERADVEAVGAALDVREAWTLVDALFDGQPDVLAAELGGDGATDMIPALRAVARRALALGRVRAGLGNKAFARERDAVEREARHWSVDALTTVHAHAMAAETAIKQPGTAGDVVANERLLALARAAARRR